MMFSCDEVVESGKSGSFARGLNPTTANPRMLARWPRKCRYLSGYQLYLEACANSVKRLKSGEVEQFIAMVVSLGEEIFILNVRAEC